MNVTSALTPLSLAVAVLMLVITGIALLAVAWKLARRWRRRGALGRPTALAAVLVLLGLCSWYASSVRVALVTAIYSNIYGQPSAPVPSSLIGAWPLVAHSSLVMVVAEGLTLVAIAVLALLRPRSMQSAKY